MRELTKSFNSAAATLGGSLLEPKAGNLNPLVVVAGVAGLMAFAPVPSQAQSLFSFGAEGAWNDDADAGVGAHCDILSHGKIGEGLDYLKGAHHAYQAYLVRLHADEIPAAVAHASRIRLQEARYHGEQGCFPRTKAASQADDIT